MVVINFKYWDSSRLLEALDRLYLSYLREYLFKSVDSIKNLMITKKWLIPQAYQLICSSIAFVMLIVDLICSLQ